MRATYRFIVAAVICLSVFTVNQAASESIKKGDKIKMNKAPILVCQTPQLVLKLRAIKDYRIVEEMKKEGLCAYTPYSVFVGTVLTVSQDDKTVQIEFPQLFKVPVWVDRENLDLCKGLAC